MDLRTELTTVLIRQGKEDRALAWMALLSQRQRDCVSSLDREHMHVESVFKVVRAGRLYLSWYSVQAGRTPREAAALESSPWEIDRLHLAFWRECVEPEAPREEHAHVVSFLPDEVASTLARREERLAADQPPSGTAPRPAFIVTTRDVPEVTHVYPRSTEAMGPSRAIGYHAGLQRIGVHVQRVPPGTRSSWPHAESAEEEFVYVLAGEVQAWIDGHLHAMRAGDFAAFPSGTGIAHCFINDSTDEVVLLVGGEASKAHNRIDYPRDPGRREDLPPSAWWDDAPVRERGPHDGRPANPPQAGTAPVPGQT